MMNNTIRALYAEDEAALAMIITDTLKLRGIEVFTAVNGEEAWQSYQRKRPDIIIVDIMMPKLDGYGLVTRIRQVDTETPIIFLSARDHIDDILKGFEVGGDDYLKKPFNIKELEARIKALSRRTQGGESPASSSFSIGAHFRLDRTRQLLQYQEETPEQLSYRESELLWYLANQIGKVVSSDVLLNALWGNNSIYNQRSLHVFISHLRRHLRQDRNLQIINIRGVGYKLVHTGAFPQE